jgi:RNA-directed DNA polymerase
MSDKRQKNQLSLAFAEEYRGEAPDGLRGGTESLAVKRGTESAAINEQLMEEVCERENCKQALARVKANRGGAGMDGMAVQQLPEFLKQNWPVIREQLLSGTYKPQPVKRVEIPGHSYGFRPGRSAHQAWSRRRSISPKAIAGWWIWIWRGSSTG